MNTNRAIELLERMRDPEAWEPKITADAEEALGMGIDAIKEVEKIRVDIDEMKRLYRELELELEKYTGAIKALEFVIKCNGVSGDAVKDGAL